MLERVQEGLLGQVVAGIGNQRVRQRAHEPFFGEQPLKLGGVDPHLGDPITAVTAG